MITLSLILALSNGALLSLQQVTNAALGLRIGSVGSSVINHLVGALFAGLLLIIGFQTGRLNISGIPLLYFLGGALGVSTVAMGNYAIPRIGVVMTAILFTSSQLFTSSLIDHFGLLGAKHIPLTPSHAIGILLIIIGATLVFTKEKPKTLPATEARINFGEG